MQRSKEEKRKEAKKQRSKEEKKKRRKEAKKQRRKEEKKQLPTTNHQLPTINQQLTTNLFHAKITKEEHKGRGGMLCIPSCVFPSWTLRYRDFHAET